MSNQIRLNYVLISYMATLISIGWLTPPIKIAAICIVRYQF